ncbi:MAG: hypothetical protein LBH43_07730, partial [Treponema sp.]|nr:hypothetical protein [Treponema sp.]
KHRPYKGEGRIPANQRHLRTVQQNLQRRVLLNRIPEKSLPEYQRNTAWPDEWAGRYNHERARIGKYCYGKTPVQAFMDSIPLAKDKLFGYDVSDGQPA